MQMYNARPQESVQYNLTEIYPLIKILRILELNIDTHFNETNVTEMNLTLQL